MKLKNKLMPLVGLTAVCATAIPLASCANSSISGSINLLDEYKPAIESLDYREFEDLEEVYTTYFDSNFSKHFIDDYYFSTANMDQMVNNIGTFDGFIQNGKIRLHNMPSSAIAPLDLLGFTFGLEDGDITLQVSIKKDNEKLYDVSPQAKEEKLKIFTEDEVTEQMKVETHTFYEVSYKLEYELETETTITYQQTGEQFTAVRNIKGKVEVNNLPMTVTFDTFGLFASTDQFIVCPDAKAIAGMWAYWTGYEKRPEEMIKISAYETYKGVNTLYTKNQGTQEVVIDEDRHIGFKDDGSFYHGEEEGQYEFEQFLSNIFTAANIAESNYLYQCRLLDQE